MRLYKASFTLLMFLAPCLHAQALGGAPKPEPDVLIFKNGEKLIGHLKSSTAGSVVFKSENAGDITVKWEAIQELHTTQKYAAIPKGTEVGKHIDKTTIPQGTVAMTDQKVTLNADTPAATKTLPVGDVANLVDQPTFEKAFHRTKFTDGWKGGATAGLSLTEATQKNQTFTAALNMVRSIPPDTWMDQRGRTIFDFNEAYGKISQPGSPTVKTSLYHIDAEQDWYVSQRLFVFVGTAFDHSFSQGLSLQQSYGGGVGAVVLKTKNQELDFKASANFINQRFDDSTQNKKLVGSTFSETYLRKFVHGILLSEQGGVTPAWNNTRAYSAFASAALTFPVYHRFGLTLGALDNFLNDPPPGFRKNSFQFTAGATYSFK